MADSSQQDMIMEEREELMVSPTGGQPTLRTAHFLKPFITSTDGPLFALPQQTTATGGREQPLRFTYQGWKNYRRKDYWVKWVEAMRSLHESAWKKAGIYEAVMNSTYRIHRNDDLILAFARKWSPETKTFLFPWGEATLTLEDMIVLGGFSVLGGSVNPGLRPLRDRKLEEVKQKLLKARYEIRKTASNTVSHSCWISKFRDSRCEIEHEAFLVLWLERYVFPISTYDTIGTKVLDIAIRLARGYKIALAPAVLASIYQNLTLMKEALVEKSDDCASEIAISAPFQLVQVWVWERFPAVHPNPNSVGHDKPRFARWDRLKMEVKNVMLAIDSAGDDFLWRPYALWTKYSQLYKEKERWILVNGGLDEELEALVRCLRVSELVGMEKCIEQYLPHRVAMQFGMDQDLPGQVARADESSEIAWKFYTRPVLDVKLYVPPRLFESAATTRYLQWWEKSAPKRNGIRGAAKRKQPQEQGGDPSHGRAEVDICTNSCNENNGRSEDLHTSKVREKELEAENLSGNRPTSFDSGNGGCCTIGTSLGTSKIPGEELEARIENLEILVALMRGQI